LWMAIAAVMGPEVQQDSIMTAVLRGEDSGAGHHRAETYFPLFDWLRARQIAICLTLVLGFAICAGLYLLIDRRVMRNRRAWFNQRVGRMLMICGFGLVTIGGLGGIWITGTVPPVILLFFATSLGLVGLSAGGDGVRLWLPRT
jgi:hypothetical protein